MKTANQATAPVAKPGLTTDAVDAVAADTTAKINAVEGKTPATKEHAMNVAELTKKSPKTNKKLAAKRQVVADLGKKIDQEPPVVVLPETPVQAPIHEQPAPEAAHSPVKDMVAEAMAVAEGVEQALPRIQKAIEEAGPKINELIQQTTPELVKMFEQLGKAMNVPQVKTELENQGIVVPPIALSKETWDGLKSGVLYDKDGKVVLIERNGDKIDSRNRTTWEKVWQYLQYVLATIAGIVVGVCVTILATSTATVAAA